MTQNTTSDAPRSSRLVTLVGGLGIFMFAVGILIGAVNMFGPRTDLSRGVPSIVLIEPQTGDTVSSPLMLRFTAGNELALGGMGWASNDLHLHAYVDGREIMPAAADIQDVGDGTFIWTLPADSGPRAIQLRWAGLDHRDLDVGASRVVEIVVQPENEAP
jgi:hypothetical protein